MDRSPLLALPLAGGPEREIAKCVSDLRRGSGGPLLRGMLGHERRRRPSSCGIRRRAEGGSSGKLDRTGAGLTVSPDGKTILFTKASARAPT